MSREAIDHVWNKLPAVCLCTHIPSDAITEGGYLCAENYGKNSSK
jgi:hypothetical protein